MNDHELHDDELRAGARQLGRDAERLDVERIAEQVVVRLREQPARPNVWRATRWLRAAAVIVVCVGAGLLLYRDGPGPEPVTVSDGLPAGVSLEGLSPAALREVLNAMDQPLDVEPVNASETGLEDLTAPELRRLLHSLES